jgi:hypothetical protein
MKITKEEFIKKARAIHGDKYDYSLVDYVNNRKKVNIIYNGVIYEQIPNNHLRGFKCENIKYLTKEEFIKKARAIHGDKYDYSLVDFKNVRGKIKLIYNGKVYEQFAYAHLKGKSPEKAPFKITNKIFKKRSKELFGDLFDYSLVECDGNKNKVKLIHDGKIYEQVISDHLSGHLPSGLAPKSKGEINIENYLKSNNIKFINQYKINECRNLLPLPFDFYLPELNILIEYDGRQHFEPISLFGGNIGLKKRKKNDNIKNKYCEENKIPLLRISYLENIDIKLDIYFKSYLKL